jgi:hypothetical protein
MGPKTLLFNRLAFHAPKEKPPEGGFHRECQYINENEPL